MPLTCALFGVIPMPADQLIFIGVGLLFDAVIDNRDAVSDFQLAAAAAWLCATNRRWFWAGTPESG